MTPQSYEPLALLSRVADSAYWIGRYIERADNVARYLAVNLNLQLDLPMETCDQWQPLIDITGDTEAFKERYGSPNQETVLEFLLYDEQNPNSIYSCVRAARENARSMRETITASMWEQINATYLDLRANRDEGRLHRGLDDFARIQTVCHAFQGITDATMTHDEAWHFMDLGQKLERADQTSRILDVKYFLLLPSVSDLGGPYDDIQWSAVLRSVSAFGMYRRKHGRINRRDIVEFLVLDHEFPRAIHYCVNAADAALHAITGTPGRTYRYASEQAIGMLRARLDYASVDTLIDGGLHEYLDELQIELNRISCALQGDFIADLQSQSASQG